MDEKKELLIDLFFDYMHHNAAIVYPYYANPEYAKNIANDYLEENPNFTLPEKNKNDSYELSKELLSELKSFCKKRCTYYEYDKEEMEES